jgi:hypothetical protein
MREDGPGGPATMQWTTQSTEGKERAVFLNLLDAEEKRAFVALAEKMIASDGLVIGREEAALASLKAEMGFAESGGDGRSVEDLAGVFGSWRSKVAALLELMGLGYSDTSFSVDEKSLVTTVADQMGLTPNELAELEEWVREYVHLIRRALILMRD